MSLVLLERGRRPNMKWVSYHLRGLAPREGLGEPRVRDAECQVCLSLFLGSW